MTNDEYLNEISEICRKMESICQKFSIPFQNVQWEVSLMHLRTDWRHYYQTRLTEEP